MRPCELLGLKRILGPKRADAGVNLTPALTPHNPMGWAVEVSGWSTTLTSNTQPRASPRITLLCHALAQLDRARPNKPCLLSGSRAAISVSTASTWLTTTLVQMCPWIGHRYVTTSTPSRVG
jgi:hypothetical protein